MGNFLSLPSGSILVHFYCYYYSEWIRYGIIYTELFIQPTKLSILRGNDNNAMVMKVISKTEEESRMRKMLQTR
jgi:hypothetical protein